MKWISHQSGSMVPAATPWSRLYVVIHENSKRIITVGGPGWYEVLACRHQRRAIEVLSTHRFEVSEPHDDLGATMLGDLTAAPDIRRKQKLPQLDYSCHWTPGILFSGAILERILANASILKPSWTVFSGGGSFAGTILGRSLGQSW